ncbi:eukaryotic translation initiation factor 4 gamma 3-like isoform X2 [Chelonus insularis]|uniref:eukaryotic translation initiation factor 4 gamma 3-like isoform X2 n=1 Tax=Chelonus insularis TaxID=460826 RepID=UPI00158CB32A|nr:eukaryotic translation initiation factor 4 gamma 3-like isoform X2 [Chelonus insularis]
MPAKQKHHHLSHHHHQPQSQAPQQQHLVNVNQSGISGVPQYNAVAATRYVAHASSDFHVPGQSYGAQPGGQVGGGASSLGVSGGRGPPSLSGIQSLGQTTPGLQSGGPAGAQQPPAQTPTPGVQQQQPQGPPVTTTPPVHTPSPQEMGKQIHHPSQSASLQQSYVTNQSRAVQQGFFPMATRPVQSRNSGHRNSQGSGASHVVSMPGVAGGAGQPPTLYSHHGNINVPGTPMLVPGQVPSIHTGHHTTMYSVNNQMSQIAFQQHRHQAHQGQQFFTSFPAHALIQPNIFPYTPGPTAQFQYCYPPHHPQNTAMNLSRTNTNTMSGGGQHIGGPLAGAQGTAGVPQGTLQQPSQQPQTIPQMAISLTPTAYTGHSTGTINSINPTYQKVTARPCALMDIVDPTTGKNVAEDIYRNAAASPSEDSNSKDTNQPQNHAIIAQFASLVAKAANEDLDTNTSSSANNVQNNQQSSTQSSANNQSIRNSRHAAASPSEDSNSKDTSQPQNHAIVAQFASLVAKAANGDSDTTTSSSASNVQHNQQSSTQSSANNQSIRNSRHAAASPSEDSNSKDSSQLQNHAIVAQFASLVAKAANGDSATTTSSSASNVQHNQQSSTQSSANNQSIRNSKTQSTSSKDSKPSVEEPTLLSNSTISNKENNSTIQSPSSLSTPSGFIPDTESKNVSPTDSQGPSAITDNSQPANGSPVLFSNRDHTQNVKTSSNSPPRRKSHNHYQQPQQPSANISVVTAANNSSVSDVPATNKDSIKDKKINDKTLNTSNKVASSTIPNQNEQQPTYHHKSNEDGIEDKTEMESGAKNDVQQKASDSKSMQKQKNKNKLKGRDLNRKGAEKEGTDMDAFVNPVPQPVKPEEKEPLPSKTGPNVELQQQQQQPPIIEAIVIEKKEKNSEKVEPTVLSQQEQLVKSLSVETTVPNSLETPVKDDVPVENSLTEKIVAPVVEELEKKVVKDSPAIIEDSKKSSNLPEKKNNDVVDHAIVNDTDIEAIVAQKNEENTKVSANLRRTDETNLTDTSVIEKQNDNEPPNKIETVVKAAAPQLNYKYNNYQWSPTNTSGKKEYDRDFLMKLQDDPRCKIRPANLPDLEVVLKDCSRQTTRNNNIGMRIFKDTRVHEQFFPEFSKSSFGSKLPPPMNKKSYQGKSKVIKPNVIHVSLSLREDVKLRETENAWRPTHLKPQNQEEENQKIQTLYKKVRSILNKLTPQKFTTLVNQMKELNIDTQEKLDGVIKLVFEKAIDEPNFSEAYALMCSELSNTTTLSATEQDKKEKNAAFRKTLLIRCQTEFEKNAVDEEERAKKLKEIDDCTEPDKKKELQMLLEEEDRRIRLKSVGNIRFIGELYKLRMLKPDIMDQCIQRLLRSIDEENLECLCKLLSTIGKIYEKKNNLSDYFKKLEELVSTKNRKINSRVRFMIQDVIDLRLNNWIPRREENNPKTIDQIQKEVESERIEYPLNNPIMNTPRKDDRNNDNRRKNRGPHSDDGWSSVGKRIPFAVETSKFNTKPPAMDEIKLGNRSNYLWNVANAGNKFAVLSSISSEQDKRSPCLPLSGSRSTGPREYRIEPDTHKSAWNDNRGSRNGSHPMGSGSSSSNSSRENSIMDGSKSQSISMPPPSNKFKPTTISSCMPPSNTPISNRRQKSEDELEDVIKALLDECKSFVDTKAFITVAMEEIQDNFDSSTYPLFIRSSINSVLDRSTVVRQRFSILLAHMINENFIPLSLFQSEYKQIIEGADELVIDIPMCWAYFAEILSELLVANAHPFSELKQTVDILKTAGTCGKLLGELFNILSKDQGPKWVIDKWDQSGLQWSDLLDSEQENIDNIFSKYKLEFLINGSYNSEMSMSDKVIPLAERIDDIHDHLIKLLRGSSFDNITSWITANVGPQSKEKLFIKTLVTAIMEVSTEPVKETYKFLRDNFNKFVPLLTRYIDAEPQLELQCLLALEIQDYKLDHPQGILSNIIQILFDSSTISDEAFLAWQNYMDPTVIRSHPIVVTNLATFFEGLKDRSESSEES